MSVFTLAGEDLDVNAFTGFDRPDDVQVVNLMSSGSSTNDSVVQQSSRPSPLATMSGRTSDFEQIQLLRFWRNSHNIAEFVEPDEGSHYVVLLTLEVQKVPNTLFLWDWTATLIEITSNAVGSGVGEPSDPCPPSDWSQTAAAGASIGGHGHWMMEEEPLCSPSRAMRVTGTFHVLVSPGYPWTESSSFQLTPFDTFDPGHDYFAGGHPGQVELAAIGTYGGGTVMSYDKVTAKRLTGIGSPQWAWIDYDALGTDNWELAAFDDELSPLPDATTWRTWRSGQWSPPVEAEFTVSWLEV